MHELSKCSICSANWKDCIHVEYEDAYGFWRREQAGRILGGAAMLLVIIGLVIGFMK